MRDDGFWALVTMVVAFFLIVIGGGLWAAEYGCKAQGKQMGLETQWGVWTECMIKHKGEWRPLRSVRSFD